VCVDDLILWPNTRAFETRSYCPWKYLAGVTEHIRYGISLGLLKVQCTAAGAFVRYTSRGNAALSTMLLALLGESLFRADVAALL
jgi:hypothetical protein